jgi:predicted MPP superfamily phosphohydrolase
MSMIKSIINGFLGRSRIDHVVNLSANPKLLHISDTPSQFYSELKRIITELQPDYIIHTGDLALHKYKHEVKSLLRILRESSAKKVIVSLGNHDDRTFVREHSGRIMIFERQGDLTLEGVHIAFSHYSTDLMDVTSDLRLYGHDLASIDDDMNNERDLNGIVSMSLIDLVTLEITNIDYPIGTDNARLNRKKIGI